MRTFKAEIKFLEPKVGATSCVGVGNGPYPMTFGNYCSLRGGPYLCNMWAENLKEWCKRYVAENHSFPMIQVLILESLFLEMPKLQGGTPMALSKSIGFVVDDRLVEWTNPDLCVTGHGWPNEEIEATANRLHSEWKAERDYRIVLAHVAANRKSLLAKVCSNSKDDVNGV